MLALLASALACAAPGLGTATDPTAPPPVIEITPFPNATIAPPPGDAPLNDVSYEGISFAYNSAISAQVVPQTILSEEFMGGETIPEHVRFSFDGYILPGTFHDPVILVYPVAEFQANSQVAAGIIVEQVAFLADRPASPEGIPFLPLFNAAQLLRAQVDYVDFQNGTGVRFVTQYAQAAIPVNNLELFYTFQGLTDDGAHYVAVILPVSHPNLPPDDTAIPGGDYEAFATSFEAYITDVEGQLNAEAPSSFTPDLSVLDATVESLAFE
jgi:hypothetical protein